MTVLSRSLVAALAAAALFVSPVASTAEAGTSCCEPVAVCCCPAPPPPVEVVLCIQDPCTGCVYEECVCIPACCAGETPCMTWRKGLLGRKILTYTWKCCDHSIDVVITRRGDVNVRD